MQEIDCVPQEWSETDDLHTDDAHEAAVVGQLSAAALKFRISSAEKTVHVGIIYRNTINSTSFLMIY